MKIKKEIKRIVISFFIALVFLGVFGITAAAEYSEKIQAGIADSVIRFHAIANSNSDEDQQLKLRVRDKILKEVTPLIENSQSKKETVEILTKNLEFIKSIALEEVKNNGYGYVVDVTLENCKFPLKNYGEITFPQGNYDALRVTIGEGRGENFWCVMYPSICFVEESVNIEGGIKNVLTEEEYKVVTGGGEKPKIKFKIVEWWQDKK